ncbi:MAG: BON domain-containing protein [Candidatus Aminicenantales bacterium]|jgi:osmotically-inducible protein OsmY
MKKKYGKTLMMGAVVLLMMTGSLFAQETDRRIESAFKKSYVFNAYLKGDDIQIHSQDGVVTLTGTVSEETHLSLAADTVADLPGVKSVDNRLEVKGEIPEKNSDAWIHMKVKTMLMLHSNLAGANIEVGVKDGRVTLQGEVGSQAKKELTTELVRDVEGVKEVDNEMTVAKAPHEEHKTVGEFVDDASIYSQIKLALLFHRGTNVFRTEISVEKGVVTVSGKARNAAEIELVTKRIEDIHGVKKIYNRMIIE